MNVKPKNSCGYLTPQSSKSKNVFKLRRTGSNENFNIATDLNESFFQKLMDCPIKRQVVLSLINSEKDNIEAYKRKLSKEEKRNDNQVSSLSKLKLKRKHQCESPTALLRRRALEKQNRPNVLCENQENNVDSDNGSNSRQSDHESDSSSCPSVIPFNKLLAGVIAYVEIRSKDQDRSNGAKLLMSSMGAVVRDKFTKDVTHVVFKDGSFSTYQKAKLMKVHLVSVLWIEAVRSSNMRVPEKKFPALGTESYDSNVSMFCSQLQKDYEEIIRDELRLSLATGTPLPSTKTIIDRRRTIMTPMPSSSQKFSQNLCSSSDKEVEDILLSRRKTHTFVRSESTSSAKLSSGLLTDDDSDLGPFINGKVVQRENDSLILNLLASNDPDFQQNIESSNMELTLSETPVIDSSKNRQSTSSHSSMEITTLDNVAASNDPHDVGANENCFPKETSNKSICSKKKRLEKKISLVNNVIETPDSSLRKRKSRRTNDNSNIINSTDISDKSKSKVDSVGSLATNMSVLELSVKSSNIHILSKNICSPNNNTSHDLPDSTSNIVGKSSSTNMSSLQISDQNENPKGVSTSSSMSALVISTDLNKDKTTDDTNQNQLKKTLEVRLSRESCEIPTSKGKESFSPINSNVVEELLQILDDSPLNNENITHRRKRNSVEKGQTHNTRRKTVLFTDTETVSDECIEDLSKQLKLLKDVNKITDTSQKDDVDDSSKKEVSTKKVTKRKSKIVEQLPITPKKPCTESSLCEEKKDDTLGKKRDNLKTKQKIKSNIENTSEDSSNSEKKTKTRKLYDPDESIKEAILNEELERRRNRMEVKKRKSNEGVITKVDIPTVLSKTVITSKSKACPNTNKPNVNVEKIENEANIRKKTKSKKDVKENSRVSEFDEQQKLAAEFINRKEGEKLDNVAMKESSSESPKKKGEYIERRKSKRLSQYRRKNSNSDDKASSSENENKLTTPRINRRSTMEFQTKSQMNSNRKLKIDKCKPPSIVCTKFHKEEIQTFNQIVKKLGVFVIEDEVSSKTTHLVAGEPKRTINMLRAMARGCWILKHEWLLRSLEAGKWLPEEDYEETDFSSAVQECRLQRQAFGPSYTMDIFQDCGPIYIAKGTIPRCSDLRELVSLCRGNVCNIPRNAAIVVGEYVRYEGVKCVKEAWVLDCIMFNKKLSLRKYIISTSSSPVV